MRAEDPDERRARPTTRPATRSGRDPRGEVALKEEQRARGRGLLPGGPGLPARGRAVRVGRACWPRPRAPTRPATATRRPGNVYIRAGLKERAAASFERGQRATRPRRGSTRRPATAARRSSSTRRRASRSRAARPRPSAGDRDRAIALLQRVAPSDENYRPPRSCWRGSSSRAKLPGPGRGARPEGSLGSAVSAANIDLYYWLARGHEASGNGTRGARPSTRRFRPRTCSSATWKRAWRACRRAAPRAPRRRPRPAPRRRRSGRPARGRPRPPRRRPAAERRRASRPRRRSGAGRSASCFRAEDQHGRPQRRAARACRRSCSRGAGRAAEPRGRPQGRRPALPPEPGQGARPRGCRRHSAASSPSTSRAATSPRR